MKVTLFHCIVVAFWRFGCYAENLDSLYISATTGQYEKCQHCLLVYAGAIHVEETEEAVQDNYILNYWVVGAPKLFAANLMRCISERECYNLKIKTSNALISTEGIGGIFSQLPPINRPTETDVSAKQTLSVTPVGTSNETRADLPVEIEHMNHSGLKRNEQEPEEVCLYGKIAFSTPTCEQCLRTKSGSGIFEKYVLLQREGFSFVYVIKTSDSKSLLKFCHRWKFCRAASAVLSNNLCKLFKHKVSSQVDQSGNIPKVHGTFMENFKIFPSNNATPRRKASYEEQLQEIDLSTRCLSTTKVFHKGRPHCWRCLASVYEGIVILGRVEGNNKENQRFIITLLTDKQFLLESNPCSSSCGTFAIPTDCMLDADHVSRLNPTNNIVKWMERQEQAQQDSHVSTLKSGCLLVRHEKATSKCHKRFPNNILWTLSPVSFLVLLSTISEISYSWKTDDKFDCEHLELMPHIMCDYEMNRMKNNLDLNNLPDGNEGSPPVSDTNSRPVYVANVVVINWTALDPDNVEEVTAFGNCFICLARKRKVVLISVNKRYLWMVDSGSLPNCKACDGRVTFGPQFPYNQYLRQIPVRDAIIITDTSEEEQKRPRLDELGLNEAFDEDLTRLNQETDEFRRRSKRVKALHQ
uniref:AlNc14C361G10994 protein n=1 Tax=Albugo laibachii Nc14 TaxID=890382 RepID=F0WXQ8_9STRA|nr:AlNc14C361G10994 [Albugo laibachii Nc14]|eukprot:CCA26254.1 AlNc14C361G10994 [Albugo laibachii Nc14]